MHQKVWKHGELGTRKYNGFHYSSISAQFQKMYHLSANPLIWISYNLPKNFKTILKLNFHNQCPFNIKKTKLKKQTKHIHKENIIHYRMYFFIFFVIIPQLKYMVFHFFRDVNYLFYLPAKTPWKVLVLWFLFLIKYKYLIMPYIFIFYSQNGTW